MRGPSKLLALCFCFILLPAIVHAQASIAGVVRDSSGAVLPGVTVEAASPALIEKVRSVVTDESGQYRVIDLRPGAYVVTFTLPGFSTVRREGIQLSGFATTSVNVELSVGAVEETITVSGESPIVDVQNTTKQSVLDHAVIDALPTNRNSFGLGILITGTVNASGFGQDVGGITGTAPSALGSHGSRTQDQRLTINGVALSTMQGGGWGGALVPNAAGLAEQTIDTAAVTAELATGGVRINYIPKDGGNTFSGTAFFDFANDALQGTNLDSELVQRGLPTTRALIKNWSVNPGAGGPLKRDRVWFYASGQSLGSYLYAPGIFPNKNAGNPNVWVYEADPSRRAENDFLSTDYQLRLTWQAARKHKVGFLIDYQSYCRCPNGISATISPEAASDDRWPLQRPIQFDWTSPVTNSFLFEAAGIHRVERWGSMELGHGPTDDVSDPRMISVTEQSLGNLVYRSRATYSNNWNRTFHYRVAASYITGTHALKVGFNDASGMARNTTATPQPISYLFNNFRPVSLTMRATPYTDGVNVDHDLGLFVQDKWTLSRFTIGLGLRYDHFATSFPDLSLGPSVLFPTRNLSFPGRDNLSWHDITPKSNFVWDVTGTGKTAIKVSLNKYLEGMGLTGLTQAPSPVASLATDSTTNRTWGDANGNFIPDCDLLNPLANGECGVFSNPNFGTARNSTSFDPAIITGWGIRHFNWEFGTSVQHEVMPRVSLDVGYYRRWYGNFLAQDDRSVAASDFDTFSITAPRDSRLPDGGGYAVSNLRILKTGAIGRPVDTYVTLVDNLPGSPKRTEQWNGVDVSVALRPRNGLMLQGGVSTGKTSENYCEMAAAVPEFIPLDRNGNRSPTEYIYGLTPSCDFSTPFLTQVKAFGSYVIPKIDVQVGATLQNTQGPEVRANYTLTNAVLQTALGRNLGVAGFSNTTVNVLERGSMYGERMNQMDLRIGKLLRVGRTRTTLSVNVYNLLNGNAVLTQNNTLAVDAAGNVTSVWQRPQSILDARFVKFSAQFDF
jgi:hypothetical protein